MKGPLFVATVLPVLIAEGAKVARRYLKEKRKQREAEQRKQESEQMKQLRERIERLEMEARWRP